jgi:hypothetical protein
MGGGSTGLGGDRRGWRQPEVAEDGGSGRTRRRPACRLDPVRLGGGGWGRWRGGSAALGNLDAGERGEASREGSRDGGERRCGYAC